MNAALLSALSSALVHSVWQCAAIAGTLAVLPIFVRTPRMRYAFACFALAGMPVAFGITVWLALPQAPVDTGTRFVVPVGILARETFDAVPVESSTQWNPVSLWIAGVVAVGLYRLVGWMAAQRLRHRGVCAAPAEWQSRLNELSRTIRSSRVVRLLESTLVETPMTIGVLRPVILVPLGLLAGMPTQQMEAILLHELAHIARYDYFINLLLPAVEALLFFHPAVWWVSRIVRRERELCCDDMVVAATSDAITYAKALAALEQHRSTQFALAATDALLMQRIHRLLGKRAANSASAMAAIVFVMLASTAAMVAFPSPEPVPLPDPAPAPIPAPMPEPAPQAPVQQPTPAAVKQRPPQAAETVPEIISRTPYENWLNQEVIWIVTPEERAVFGLLQTDDERQQFIEQFWLRRDQTPDTEANEFKEEHYRRIAWANDRFSIGIPGWKTDRGMIYVKFGPPDDVNPVPATDSHPPYEKWTYGYLDELGRSITVEFVDDKSDGNYRLTLFPEETYELVRIPGERGWLYQQMKVADLLRRYENLRPRPAK